MKATAARTSSIMLGALLAGLISTASASKTFYKTWMLGDLEKIK